MLYYIPKGHISLPHYTSMAKFLLFFTFFLILFHENCLASSFALPPTSFSTPLHGTPSLAPGPSMGPAPIGSPLLAPTPLPSVPPTRGIRAAYWPSFNAFPASSINTSYFSHIYYAFLIPSPTTYRLDLTLSDLEKIPEFTSALRGQNPQVKLILSTGGGGGGDIPTVFSQMASNNSTRAVFINSTIEIAREYGFDGVDLDWELPSNDLDMSNLGLLFKEWREALEFEAKATQKPRLLLTSAAYYSSNITYMGEPRSYPGKMMGKYVDWVSPMCYGYHGSWNNLTGFPTSLYDPDSSELSTDFGIQSWIQAGVPPEKIVLGLALYGPTWTLQDPNVNGLGAPTSGVGPGNGLLLYTQIVDFNIEKMAIVKFDGQRVSAYSYSGASWVAYDDVRSIKLKVQFAKLKSLGGYFFWALGQDMDWTLSRAASETWMMELAVASLAIGPLHFYGVYYLVICFLIHLLFS